MKKNQGITLIALVITIIVLLILAGVAISMLSGENGILRKAAEAKTKTEEAQKEESTTLLDMEIDGYFKEKGSKYKCRYGCISGFSVKDKRDTVEEFERALPEGYEVSTKYNYKNNSDEEITDKSINVTTGMAVKKDGKEVARTVIFGEVNCDNSFTQDDITAISKYINDKYTTNVEIKKFLKCAMDVNNDGNINDDDITEIAKAITNMLNEIKQDVIPKNPDSMNVYLREKEQEEYLKINNGTYHFEKVSNEDYYDLVGVQKNTSVEVLLSNLPKNTVLMDIDTDEVYKSNQNVDYGRIYLKYGDDLIFIGYFGVDNYNEEAEGNT